MKNEGHSSHFTVLLTIVIINIVLGGCGGIRPTVFVNPEYNFNYIERVAVIPFENLTKDQSAALRATRFFIAELLATETFEVIEPGEVSKVMAEYAMLRTGDLTQEQLVEIGKKLRVQAVFLGTLSEASEVRSGSSSTNIVCLVARLVETETGSSIWSAAHTENGRGFWSSLFGTGEKSLSEVTRQCVKKTLKTLIK
jgi:TolB-like protein